MVKHNNVLPNAHFHKDWQRRVKTWFNQPGKKQSRRIARKEKAARVAPRPVDGLLRPAVRCPTIKYNSKVRAGRGFTLEELKTAGIPRKLAPTIGIAVDHRRRNKSAESLQLNVARLQAYRAKLIVFPKKSATALKKATGASAVPKKLDTRDAAVLKAAKQVSIAQVLPIIGKAPREASRAITAAEKAAPSVFATLRKAQSDARLVGVRAKRAKELAEEELAKK